MASRIINPESSVEYRRMDYLAQWANKNKKILVAGEELPKSVVNNLFNVPVVSYGKKDTPNQIIAAYKRRKNQMVAWQNRFNRIVAQRGLYLSIKSNTDGTDSYVLKTKEEASLKVAGFLNDAAKKTARSVVLAEGIATYDCKMSKAFTKAEVLKAWGKSANAGTNSADNGRNKGIIV